MVELTLTVNGTECRTTVDPRDSLSDLLRENLHLTGTHVGCDHGACGACTVHLDGTPVRSCIVLAARCQSREVRTIEGTRDDAAMEVIRRHFHESHALQCGFCTPGMLMATIDILKRYGVPTEDQVRAELSGQICRCTGYMGIVTAIQKAGQELYGSASKSA